MIQRVTHARGSQRPLFRPEVTHARGQDWLGTVLLVTPVRRWIVAALSVALAATLLLFLAFAHYTRRETVAGSLVPDAGLLNVVSVSPGIIKALRVRNGQHVKTGDVLVEIHADRDSASLGPSAGRVAVELSRQREALESDIDAQDRLGKERYAALDARIASLRAQTVQLDGQVDVQRQLVTSAAALLDRIRPLSSKGFVSAVQIQQQEASLLDARGRLRELERQRTALGQDIDSVERERTSLPLELTRERNDMQRRLADVAQATARNESDRGIVLRAEHDGTVSAVIGRPGQPVSAGQVLLTVLPDGAALQARLLVPSRAIGFVEKGNRVVLRYQAFPYQKFGLQYGKVADVSRSTLSPTELGGLANVKADEPMYTVDVLLDRQAVVADGRTERVLPGMALDADILMERRRLYEWVFEPLFGAARRVGRPDS